MYTLACTVSDIDVSVARTRECEYLGYCFVRRENDRGFDGEAAVARISAQLVCAARISAQLI